jgi:DNA primase
MTMANHPRLIAEHLAEFAEIELANRELDSLRSQILEIAADEPHIEAGELRRLLAARGLGEGLDRLDLQIRHWGIWQAGADASEQDALDGWIQALTLHRKARTLHKELKDAEAALASDPNDANLAHLVDIQNQMANSEGTAALIDGFGTTSGRRLKTV